jgi:hypothetical protein
MPFYGLTLKEAEMQIDGNLHWNPQPAAKAPADYLEKLRTHPLSEANKAQYPAGFGANDRVGDPAFLRYKADTPDGNDYRLAPDSAAAGAGVALPPEWPDPRRPQGTARPDIGAFPVGTEPLRVGIDGRIRLGGR